MVFHKLVDITPPPIIVGNIKIEQLIDAVGYDNPDLRPSGRPPPPKCASPE